MSEKKLHEPWIVYQQDYTDYYCEEHAVEWARAVNLEELNPTHYQKELPGYGVVMEAYEVISWARGETDYPVACSCGKYLDISLTKEGEDYVAINDFPQWLKEAHAIESQ
jgi:hypothetical protein